MNNRGSRRKYPDKQARRRLESGQSTVELASMATILVTLLLVAGDFSRMFYVSITLNNAARAGAQYGSQSLITAADSTGMQTAANNDGSNVAGFSVIKTSECTCGTALTVAACPSSYCTNNPQATYVEVDTQATFQTVLSFGVIPASLTLTGKAIMQVQQ